MPKPSPRLAIGLVVAVALSMLACDANGSSPGTTPEMTAAADLAGTSWTIVSVGGVPAAAAAPATLVFDAGRRVTGSTGCNSLNGAYSVDGPSLAFGPLATTRRACEPPLMEQETAVLDALAGVAGWEVDDEGRLHLTGAAELVLAPTGP